MKKYAKAKMYSLIAAIVLVVVAVSFFVPYTLAYFNNKNKFGGETDTPTVLCFVQPSGFSENIQTINKTQKYVSNSSLSGTNDLGISAKVISKSNIPTLLRVKLIFHLASQNNSLTQSDLIVINNNLTANINASNWVLGTDATNSDGSKKEINSAGGTNVAYLTTYYLYYKGVVAANTSGIEIPVFDTFKQIDDYYNNKYLVCELYCEAIQANQTGAYEWVNEDGTISSGWESTWYNSVKDII